MVGDVCARGKIQSPRQAWLVPCAELRSLRTGKATLCLALCLMGPTSPETPLATGLAGSPVQLGPGHCPPLSTLSWQYPTRVSGTTTSLGSRETVLQYLMGSSSPWKDFLQASCFGGNSLTWASHLGRSSSQDLRLVPMTGYPLCRMQNLSKCAYCTPNTELSLNNIY
jgi:hypothetical protein